MASVSSDGKVATIDMPWCPAQCAVGTGVTFESKTEGSINTTFFAQNRTAAAAAAAELIVPPANVPLCPLACVAFATSATPVSASAAPTQGGFVVQFVPDASASGASPSSQ